MIFRDDNDSSWHTAILVLEIHHEGSRDASRTFLEIHLEEHEVHEGKTLKNFSSLLVQLMRSYMEIS